MKKKILVIDVGGTHVKLMISRAEKRKFNSGLRMTPREMVTQMKPLLADWSFAAVSVGFPSPVRDGRILSDPKHLGRGWVGFDFEKALGKAMRGGDDKNGRFFRKAIKLYGTLLSQTWRSRLARLEEVGRRASAYQAWKKRNARNRCLLGPP